jgi:hypothetical protein
MTQTLYRAADSSDITGPTAFAAARETAEAYLDNPGFGGAILWTVQVDVPDAAILDVRSESDSEQVQAIVAATGLDMGAATADWLVMQDAVAEALVALGYRWVRLLDTYPVGAETWVCLHAEEDQWLEDDMLELE